jgi:polyketide synthase 12
MGDGEFWASLDLYDAQGTCVGRLEAPSRAARRSGRAARMTLGGVDRFQFDLAWRNVETGPRDVWHMGSAVLRPGGLGWGVRAVWRSRNRGRGHFADQ